MCVCFCRLYANFSVEHFLPEAITDSGHAYKADFVSFAS